MKATLGLTYQRFCGCSESWKAFTWNAVKI